MRTDGQGCGRSWRALDSGREHLASDRCYGYVILSSGHLHAVSSIANSASRLHMNDLHASPKRSGMTPVTGLRPHREVR